MNQNCAVLLKRAIIEGVNERYEKELAESKESVACSQEHLQNMSEILGFDVQKAQKLRKRNVVAAAVILAAALAVGSLTVYANREQIREFFIQVFEEYIVLEFPGKQVQGGVAENYRVGYVPEGYTLTKEERSTMHTYYEWNNEEGQILSFFQMSLNAESRYDGENSNTEIIEHNGLQVFCFQHQNYVSYTWNDGKYALDIHDWTKLPVEEIFKMIESITE